MQRTQCNENPDFAICEIAIESEPSDSTCDLDRRSNSRQIGTRGTSRSQWRTGVRSTEEVGNRHIAGPRGVCTLSL
jgi:hypothetical protein